VRGTMIRVGVVGCGAIARAVHLPLLAQLPGVRVAALADPVESQRASARVLAPAAAVFEDADALLRAPLDAVVICSPTGCHAAHARAAVDRGLHIYLEKPMATSLADGVVVRDAWHGAGVVGMMGFNYRFSELTGRLRAHLQRGTVGSLVAARTTFCSGPGAIPKWKQRRESGGGVLLDLGSHHIDLLRFLLEREIRSVRATLWSRSTEEDCALLELKLEGGSRVQSLLAFGVAAADRIDIYGEWGHLAVDRSGSWDVEHESAQGGIAARLTSIKQRVGTLGRVRFVLDKLRSPLQEPSYRRALERFVESIRGVGRGEPDFDDGLACLAVIEAAELSARCGQEVEIRDVLTSVS
jgi:predicted dehydrogenase